MVLDQVFGSCVFASADGAGYPDQHYDEAFVDKAVVLYASIGVVGQVLDLVKGGFLAELCPPLNI